MSQLMVLHRKWFGDRVVTEDSLGEALFLERDFWEKQTAAINNGIVSAMT